MPFQKDPTWSYPQNNDSSIVSHFGEIIDILTSIPATAKGDQGLIKKLKEQSSDIKITKGVHQKNDLHITLEFCGALWHVFLRQGKLGCEVSEVSQRQPGFNQHRRF
ncbi:MAG TPA: hypothetical protein VGQ99_17300 [Tepidisphaeraceae bacterium]|jgi:hypothetical protein|nr:hypothetical protein [Tepidisphaeraceae bacterium]